MFSIPQVSPEVSAMRRVTFGQRLLSNWKPNGSHSEPRSLAHTYIHTYIGTYKYLIALVHCLPSGMWPWATIRGMSTEKTKVAVAFYWHSSTEPTVCQQPTGVLPTVLTLRIEWQNGRMAEWQTSRSELSEWLSFRYVCNVLRNVRCTHT